jgi:hypothetical protein
VRTQRTVRPVRAISEFSSHPANHGTPSSGPHITDPAYPDPVKVQRIAALIPAARAAKFPLEVHELPREGTSDGFPQSASVSSDRRAQQRQSVRLITLRFRHESRRTARW